MNETVIYDSNGIPTLRLLAEGRILDFGGNSVGFLKNIHVYDYNGTHRGFFEGGILRDHSGSSVGFADSVTSSIHPILPYKQTIPIKKLAEIEPIRPFTEIPPLKLTDRLDWSSLTPLELFGL
jgi:hypothetical protein